MSASNGTMAEEEKKPGIVRKISKITFTIGPIRQEDLSTPNMNKLMAMAQRFDISFDTVSILDSDQTDKLGYVTLPFEIRTQEYLLVLYDRLTNLKLSPNRDVSVKFPEELKNHVEEVRTRIHEEKKQKIADEREKAEKIKRTLYATYVDKDTGKESLEQLFPEAKEITLSQHNFQWFGCMEFESADKALEILKKKNVIEIEDQKVKLVRTAPGQVVEKKSTPQQQNRKRPSTGGGYRGGHNYGPKPLLSSPVSRSAGVGGSGMNRGYGAMNAGYRDYNSGYTGGYGNQGYSGNFQLGGYSAGGGMWGGR